MHVTHLAVGNILLIWRLEEVVYSLSSRVEHGAKSRTHASNLPSALLVSD
jgi:hypothetical protein